MILKFKIVVLVENIDDFIFDSFELVGYDLYLVIKVFVVV